VVCREGVDDRDKPGQGDLELLPGPSKQPISLEPDSRWTSPSKGHSKAKLGGNASTNRFPNFLGRHCAFAEKVLTDL
jgi:hypothetical protein